MQKSLHRFYHVNFFFFFVPFWHLALSQSKAREQTRELRRPRSCCCGPSSSRCSWPASGCGRTGSWSSRSPAGTATRRCCPSPRDPGETHFGIILPIRAVLIQAGRRTLSAPRTITADGTERWDERRLTSLESILASSLALRMRLTIHLSASSGVMLSLSASMLSRETEMGEEWAFQSKKNVEAFGAASFETLTTVGKVRSVYQPSTVKVKIKFRIFFLNLEKRKHSFSGRITHCP